MVTFGIPSQFLRRPNKARGVSTIHGSNEPHKCNGTHNRGHTDYRTLVFSHSVHSRWTDRAKSLPDYKERPVSASLVSAVRKHSCLSLARLPLIWGGTEIPKWGQGTKICVLPAKQ